MPTISRSHLAQPKDWDEFEEMCADVFGAEWADPNTTRYGRQGQRQNGVDIYGRPSGSGYAGIQCKGRRRWPPRPLTTEEMDEEVGKALKFRPLLTEFTFATIAPDDARILDHARLITERHAPRGLFSVHVVGWDEFVRRLTKHGDLIEKYYNYVSIASIRDEIRKTPEETARLVIEQLTIGGRLATKAEAAALDSAKTLAEGANAALDRDVAARFRQAMQRSLFPEAQTADPFSALAQEILQGPGRAASPGLRRRVLLRASRMAAVHGEIDQAEALLAAGSALNGEDSDLPPKARLAHAQGRPEEAIRLLRDERDADSVSTLLSILLKAKGDEVALQLLQERKVALGDLTPGGVTALSQIQMRRHALSELNKGLDGLTEEQLSEAPYLLLLRGACRLASVFPEPYQSSALTAIPIEVSFAQPSVGNQELVTRLDDAIADLERVHPIAQELDLRTAARVVRWYVMWCKLLHPNRRATALTQLRSAMQSPANAVQLVLLALEYDAEFDPTELEEWLRKRDTLGGLDEYDFRAALALRIHSSDPKGIVELIATHRTVCEDSLGKPLAMVIETRALAKSGDAAAARRSLEASRSDLDPAIVQQLEAEIATVEGADAVGEHLRIYESTQSLLALRGLVDALIRKQDHRMLGKYAELLYAKTGDPEDLVNCAKAFARAGDHENFIRVMQEHPFLKERDPTLKRALAWRLFEAGRLKDAQQIADELAKSESRDLNLEVAVAIETGHWEHLGLPLGAYLRDQDRYDGLTLIRMANLAQTSGYGPFQELMQAAVRKGQRSAQVLLGAYTVAVEGGLEDSKPEAHEWFQRALELSGSDGPIQRFELKELLARQVAWRDSSRKINDAIVAGDVPLTMAAPALGTTLVEAVVGSFIRNGAQSDARKRAAIPIYSGVRAPLAAGEFRRVALDVTSVLVLGWLGLLPQVMDLFPEIVIPSALLSELFEGRSRIRQFQKSRLVRAQQLKALLSSGLKVQRVSNTQQDSLAQEIGVDLASLLRAAELNNGIVVRPAPVLRLGFDGQREADMAAHSDRLSDMNSLLRALLDFGAVDQATEAAADKYFRLQDRGWPSSAQPDKRRPLYLDDVAVSYLQTTNLLEVVIRTFDAVYVGSDVEEEADAIIEMDRQSVDILRILDDIRESIVKADEAGKIVFGPRAQRVETDERDLSTMHLLSDLSRADAVVFDDRSLNKSPQATDRSGHTARTLTSLDLIEELVRRGTITQNLRQSLRHRLRVAGAALVPLDSDELYAAAIRSGSRESAELRAMRESLGLAGLRDLPRFPAEIPWFLSVNRAVKEALTNVWKTEGSGERAEAVADAVFSLQPNAVDWLGRWEGSPPPGWADAANRVMVASLAFPVELAEQAVIQRYHRWLESRALREIRDNDPRRYEAIVEQIRSFIAGVAEAKNE